MRISVTKLDIESGRFTNIARSLRKAWPSDVSLMQSQNLLSVALGYRDFHDLQGAIAAGIGPEPKLCRSDVLASVAWRLSRRAEVPLLEASSLAECLHLNTLDFDAHTVDALLDRVRDRKAASMQTIMVDEFHSYLEPDWNEKTPALLAAGVPGYRFAVLADRRIFLWSRLEQLLRKLPADFTTALQSEPRYARMPADAAKGKFYRDELLPQACIAVEAAVKSEFVLPHGFAIQWVFNAARVCVGRVLVNSDLGGIVPLVFDAFDDSIFTAAASLLCGEVIDVPPVDRLPARGEPCFTLRYSYRRGYDLANDLARPEPLRASEDGRPDPDDLVPLAADVGLAHVAGRQVLTGKVFIERGQAFVRVQSWLDHADIPAFCIRRTGDLMECADDSHHSRLTASRDAIPKHVDMLFDLARADLEGLAGEALRRCSTSERMLAIAALAFSLTSPDTLDAACRAMIDDHLSVRHSEDAVDDSELLEERESGLNLLQWLGQDTLAALPELGRLSAESVGLLLLQANGEAPGGRRAGLVSAPERSEATQCVRLLSWIAIAAASHAAGGRLPRATELPTEFLSFVVDRLLNGESTAASAVVELDAVDKFTKTLERQANHFRKIQQWREHDDRQRDLRAGGEFLYVGDPVPAQQPKSFRDIMSGIRAAHLKIQGPAALSADNLGDRGQ